MKRENKGSGNGNSFKEKFLHWAFEIGIWIKGIDGLLELVGGILFLIASPDAVNHLIINLTEHELQQDPGDWICNTLRHAGDHLSRHSKILGGVYLLSHGAIKVFLVAGILRGKLWCYPTAMIVIGLFILIQGGRLAFHFSAPLTLATGVDIAIVFLIWHEYGRHKRRQAAGK